MVASGLGKFVNMNCLVDLASMEVDKPALDFYNLEFRDLAISDHFIGRKYRAGWILYSSTVFS